MKNKRKSNFGDKVGRNTQRQRESKKSFGYLNLPKDVKVLSFDENSTRIDLDFLPYEVTDTKHPDRDDQYEIAVEGSLWYRRPFKVHRNVGVDNDTIVCLTSVGKRCPICEHRAKRIKEGAEKDEIKELYGKPRSLYVVIPLGIKKFEEVPTIWDMSDYLFQDILNDELDSDPTNRNFPDLEEGKTATLKLKWKSLGGNSYPDVRSIEFNKRDPYPESILDDVPDLDQVLKILSYETIMHKFFEEEEGGELKEIEEDSKPMRRSQVVEEDTEKSPERRSRQVKEDKEEEPVRRTKPAKEEDEVPARAARSSKSSSDPECPYGHVFGVDTEDFKECDTCEIWGKCLDKKEGK